MYPCSLGHHQGGKHDQNGHRTSESFCLHHLEIVLGLYELRASISYRLMRLERSQPRLTYIPLTYLRGGAYER